VLASPEADSENAHAAARAMQASGDSGHCCTLTIA
jgi:hypothetical protein